FVGHAGPAAEALGVNDDAFHAGRNFKAVVLYVFAGAAEDSVQQLFLWRQLALGFRRNFADENIARHDDRADTNDAVVVEVAQRLRRDVGNVTGELFLAELGLTDFDFELLDVDRGVGVVAHQLFADDDRVLEVVAVPRHERDQDVAPQRQLAMIGGGAVGED